MTKKVKEDPNHHQGKATGYELIDGVYHIAPIYIEQFNQLDDQSRAINQLLRSVNEFAMSFNQEHSRKTRELWATVYEDLGLDGKKRYRYSEYAHTIQEVKETKEGKEVR